MFLLFYFDSFTFALFLCLSFYCFSISQGESVGQAVDRLVHGRLGVLARGILLTGESEEAPVGNTGNNGNGTRFRFGQVIPTTRSRRFSITNAMASVTTPKKCLGNQSTREQKRAQRVLMSIYEY